MDEVGSILAEGRLAYLSSMFQGSVRRFIEAAYLLEIDSPAVSAWRRILYERVDLAPLLPAFSIIKDRFLKEVHSAQMELFDKSYYDTCLRRWTKFAYHDLLPLLMRNDEFVRNVMRVMGLLPCYSPEEAEKSLRQYLHEMTLPNRTPMWIGLPEEIQ